MKYLIILFLLALCGCEDWDFTTAQDDLNRIERTQNYCQKFQIDFEKLKPVTHTKHIDRQIKECKDVGAWK